MSLPRITLGLTASATALALAAAMSPAGAVAVHSNLAAVPGTVASTGRTPLGFLTPHQVRGDLGAATGTPRAWATRAVRAQGGVLGIHAARIRWELVQPTNIGTDVRGREYVGGVPVEGTDVLVAAYGGRVRQVTADGVAVPGAPSTSPVGAVAAKATAIAAMHATKLLVPAKVVRVLVPTDGHLADTYQVSVLASTPAKGLRVDISAATGRVIDLVDPSSYDAPRGGGDDPSPAVNEGKVKGKVYDPNPVVTSHDTGLRSPFETGTGADVPLDSAALTKQLKVRLLQDIVPSRLTAGVLQGTWVDVVAPVGYLDPSGGVLSYSRSDPRFVGLMGYYHIDNYQRWLRRHLHLYHINAEPQQIVPTLAEGYDNSMYMPAEDVIVYGGGGVPDAEDAEVILHEYGHAIQDDQVPGYGSNEQGGAMGEGFGDFDSANFFALTSKGFSDLCVAEWDSTTYSTLKPPCLRRMDSTKHYPKDVAGEVHDDGEMWSAYLWRVRSHLGRTAKQKSENAIRLVLTMHTLITPDVTYAKAVRGLISAAKALHHAKWTTFIIKEAKKTGYSISK